MIVINNFNENFRGVSFVKIRCIKIFRRIYKIFRIKSRNQMIEKRGKKKQSNELKIVIKC